MMPFILTYKCNVTFFWCPVPWGHSVSLQKAVGEKQLAGHCYCKNISGWNRSSGAGEALRVLVTQQMLCTCWPPTITDPPPLAFDSMSVRLHSPYCTASCYPSFLVQYLSLSFFHRPLDLVFFYTQDLLVCPTLRELSNGLFMCTITHSYVPVSFAAQKWLFQLQVVSKNARLV